MSEQVPDPYPPRRNDDSQVLRDGLDMMAKRAERLTKENAFLQRRVIELEELLAAKHEMEDCINTE